MIPDPEAAEKKEPRRIIMIMNTGTPRPENLKTKMDDQILCGRNPIREALRSGRDIEKLLVQKGELSGSARDIIREARDKKIMVQEVDRRRLDEIALHHQGLVAFARSVSVCGSGRHSE